MGRPPRRARMSEVARDEWEGPHGGIPEWLYPSVSEWVAHILTLTTSTSRGPNRALLHRLERDLRLALPWDSITAPLRAVIARLRDDDDGPEILDWCLGLTDIEVNTSSLQTILDEAGSVFTVDTDADGVPELQDRIDVMKERLVAPA